MTNKTPKYNQREMQTIEAADRVIARVRIQGKWREATFLPSEEELSTAYPVRSCLMRVQAALRHSPDFSGVCLYVGAPLHDEVWLASMPTDTTLIPNELRR